MPRVKYTFPFLLSRLAGTARKVLKGNLRIFAVVILAAKKMLDADGNPQKRGAFSLELLELLKERAYGNKRAESLQRFVGHILQIQNNDIDSDIRKELDMLSIPLNKAVEEIYVRVATEQGREEGRLQVARSMLADDVSPEVIQKYTGLDMETILAQRLP